MVIKIILAIKILWIPASVVGFFILLFFILGGVEERMPAEGDYACSEPARYTGLEFAWSPQAGLDEAQKEAIFQLIDAGVEVDGSTAKDQAILIMWAGRGSGFGKFVPAGTIGLFALPPGGASGISDDEKADPEKASTWAYQELQKISYRADLSVSATIELLSPGLTNVFSGPGINTWGGMTTLETLIMTANILGVESLLDCGSLTTEIPGDDGVVPGVPDLSTDGLWSWPVAKPHITSNFGWRFHPVFHVNKLHAGTDFQAACGTPIYAVNGGVVKTATKMQGLGNTVFITHSPVLESRSAHMLDGSLLVKKGDFVKAGQQIGLAGTTGTSTGCHLHFETHVNGTASDPMPILTGAGLSGFTGGK